MGAGTWNLPEFTIRAHKATAKGAGQPVAGKCSTTAFAATDVTVSLEADAMYQLVASTDAWFGMSDATVAANRAYLKAWVPFYLMTGMAATLHFTQVTAGGNLYIAKLDDVG
jgi:hypothetical protein